MILLLHCNLHVPPCYPTACIAATRRTLDADTRGCTPPRIPAHGRDRNGPGSAHRWSRGGREDPLAATHEFLFLFGSWGTTRRQPSPCAACVSFQNLLALPFALSFWWILMGGGGGGSFKVGGHPQPISISRAHSKRGFVVWILISVSRHVFQFFPSFSARFIYFFRFFFCEPNSAIRRVLVLFEFGFFCGGYASRLTQELRFDLFIRQFASVRANICSVVFVFL